MSFLTVLEIQLNVITSNVGGHGNNRSSVELTNEMTSGNTIEVGHYDIHEDQIISLSGLDLVDSLQPIQLIP